MKRKTIKIITSASISNTLLLSLVTGPIQAATDTPKAREAKPDRTTLMQKQEASEKVVVESRGKSLVFTVAGQPGRHCAVIAKSKGGNKQRDFIILNTTKTVIGPSGVAAMTVDMNAALDRKIQFSVVTSDTLAFNTNLRGITPVEIQMSSKQLSDIQQISAVTSVTASLATSGFAPSMKELIRR